jgi:ketosteroid isomerase-like protein
MTDNPHLPVLEQAYRNWSETKGGSFEEILDLFDDEVEMRSVLSPDIPHEISGTHRTKAEAVNYFAGLARDWEMLAYDVDRFIADGDDIVMVGRCAWRNRATGKVIDTPKVDIWHFENGKITQLLEMFDSLGFVQALGAT